MPNVRDEAMEEQDRYRNEINHLLTLKELLDNDSILLLRFSVKPGSLDFRRFELIMSGLEGLITSPSDSSSYKRTSFSISVEVPPGYPLLSIPLIKFLQPIPFHPHIFTTGNICWGTGNAPQLDLCLVDWFLRVVEYIAYVKTWINPDSPANGSAMRWWIANKRSVDRYIQPINLSRLRVWVDNAKR